MIRRIIHTHKKTASPRLPGARFLILACIAVLCFAACGQNPIFYEISNEVEPKEPLIKGAPSQIVEFQSKLYVGRKNLYVYEDIGNGKPEWTKMDVKPEGEVHDIATTGSHLYALTMDGSDYRSTKLWKSADAQTWVALANTTEYSVLQGAYAAGGVLFIGARNTGNNDHAILYDNGTSLVPIKTGLGSNGRLTGAAIEGPNLYISILDAGIFSATSAAGLAAAQAIDGSDISQLITGIINVQGTILAVTNDEKIYAGTTAGFSQKISKGDMKFTGALALWEKNGTHLLLLGIDYQSGSYTYGYREMLLTSTGELSDYTLREPGEDASTVTNRSRYRSTLGRHVVRSLMQTPFAIDPEQTLFASTQKDGLWSYRDEEWNAEE
ncbi:hypothetical protein [Breznakiella homolactica]|uniref:Uncharacterized protein n=1 Tax=Breznakiella homolactica TaxID=2798577 RepID=A0A7T7XJG2_9SPIR|nr:hypothetical protein [Breznakiella homolactica]QQO07539.1 hypothetical protein JFL75_11320 [Breznakiella homolactica]